MNEEQSDSEWWEQHFLWKFKIWHALGIFLVGFLTIMIVFCRCIRFRIPRTKQEIEADYIRKKITRKFQKQLRLIQNSEMDEMDLKKALDRVRAEFKSDTESINNQSPVYSNSESAIASPTSARKRNSGIDIEELIAKEDKRSKSTMSSAIQNMKSLWSCDRKRRGQMKPTRNV